MKRYHQKKKEDLITYLIKSCEMFNLTEKESLLAINNILGNDKISRRTYYYYKKKKVYKNDIFESLKESCYDTLDVKLLILDNELDNFNLSKKADELVGDQFPGRMHVLMDKQRHKQQLENTTSKVKSIVHSFDHNVRSCLYNFFQTPADARIKEKFIKCGNSNCKTCPHGPYYYAHWIEKNNDGRKKYLKKYLGVYDPRILEDQFITDDLFS
ncbi:MAG TPA: hypothetical protein VFG45_11190 [Candidatus Nitrosocosmicus sp.]|nr:hypothetical protein [Candidatus Nitrosocosmicus sp.]